MAGPTCAPFCSLNFGWNYNQMQTAHLKYKVHDGMRQLAFAVTPCLAQFQGRRYFALEHPQTANSWETRLMGLLMRLPGVRVIEFDFCMAGMEGEDELGRAPVRNIPIGCLS